MHRVFDPAGSDDGSRKRRRRCCLPPPMTASAPRLAFTRLNSPACAYPYRRLAAALAGGRRTARGHRDSLDLRRRAFSSPSPGRFIPALSISTTYAAREAPTERALNPSLSHSSAWSTPAPWAAELCFARHAAAVLEPNHGAIGARLYASDLDAVDRRAQWSSDRRLLRMRAEATWRPVIDDSPNGARPHLRRGGRQHGDRLDRDEQIAGQPHVGGGGAGGGGSGMWRA
jgi:hypothetical protein